MCKRRQLNYLPLQNLLLLFDSLVRKENKFVYFNLVVKLSTLKDARKKCEAEKETDLTNLHVVVLLNLYMTHEGSLDCVKKKSCKD